VRGWSRLDLFEQWEGLGMSKRQRARHKTGRGTLLRLFLGLLTIVAGAALVVQSSVMDRVAAAATAALSTRSNADPASSVTRTTSNIASGGIQRSYLLVAPKAQTRALPLIVVLHGHAATVDEELDRDELLPLAEQGKAILLYPVGYEESWNVPGAACCDPAYTAGILDTPFILSAIAQVEATVKTDTASVHLVGYSNGGRLAYSLMCNNSDIFSSVAIVGASEVETCPWDELPPRSFFLAVGDSDVELPTLATAQPAADVLNETIAAWRLRDQCTDDAVTTQQGKARISVTASCADGVNVTGVLYSGLTHIWPSAAVVGSNVSGAALISTFFLGSDLSQQAGKS
jgi:polyhydroxybutyrate depolymerase